MSERPDDNQLRVMTAPSSHAILLQGGPGSGKTRTLIGRIGYLLKSGKAQASEVVALTFTNKAAHQLQARLGRSLGAQADGVRVGTFHSLAHQILREHAEAAGVDVRFTLCDEVLQQEMFRQALQRSGASPHVDFAVLNDLRDFFSACKREGHEPTACEETHQLPHKLGDYRELLPSIAQHYRELLREHNMLDFDDLIFYAVQVFETHPAIAEAWREAHPWLFIDEFHDINQAQYQFVQVLALPASTTVMAVMDEQQRIYRWRGAHREVFTQFRNEYHPVTYQLGYNYRSGEQLMRAYDHLLRSGGVSRESLPPPNPSDFWAERPQEGLIERWWSMDDAQESEWVVSEIERLQHEEGHQLGDIALLYRSHRIGKQLEKALAQRGLPLTRIQRKPFFERREVQQVCAYLHAAIHVADNLTAASLNFPSFVTDELTMIELRRLAAQRDVTLLELMRNLPESEAIGAATRRQINDFFADIEGKLVPLLDGSLQQLSEALFGLLERRRSPYQQADLQHLRRFLSSLDVTELLTPLHRAVQNGQPIQLVAADTLDAGCAATLLSHVLKRFFALTIPIEPLETPPEQDTLRIVCGATEYGALCIAAREEAVTDNPTINLSSDTSEEYEIAVSSDSRVAELSTEYDVTETDVEITVDEEATATGNLLPAEDGTEAETRHIVRSASLIAWRLASALLVAHENSAQSDIVAFDLETTGLNPRYHSAVELAAQRLRALEPADEGFELLVNPGRSITQGAINVHGIYPQELREAPLVYDALPDYLTYLGDNILLGHNVGFDMRFLHALSQRAGLPAIQNPVLDTLALARRLFPSASSYRLEALINDLQLPNGRFHRAMPDVQHTINLFTRLWQEHRLDQQLHLLTDYLPLVAVGSISIPACAENALLIEAAARILQRKQPNQAPEWAHNLPSAIQSTVTEQLKQLTERDIPPTTEDETWHILRKEWERHITHFTELHHNPSLHAFLAHTALIHREPDVTSQEDQLQLMTIHAAKGKEFRTVFLVGLEEGNLPSYRARTREEIAEERRVCYVGMSRAKERLYLLGSAKRGGRERDPSMFWRTLDLIFEG